MNTPLSPNEARRLGLPSLAAPLDVARAAVLRSLGRHARPLLADRALRVALYGTVGILFALATTCAAPLWMFALGPVLLGPIHLLADVRYLVVRPGLLARRTLVVAVGALLVMAAATGGAAVGLAAALPAIACARAPLPRRALVGLAWSAVVLAAWLHPRPASFFVLHGHNLVALVLFLVAFARPGQRARSLLPMAVFVVAAGAMMSGSLDAFVVRSFTAVVPRTALSMNRIVHMMAPLEDGVVASRLALLFIFAQSVHYVFWLRLVPEAARERSGLRSFASSIEALQRDVGTWLVVFTVLATAALAVHALRSMEGARIAYLHVAGPHAYLEIAVLFVFLLDRDVRATLPAAARIQAPARTAR